MVYDCPHDPCKPQSPEYFASFAGDITLGILNNRPDASMEPPVYLLLRSRRLQTALGVVFVAAGFVVLLLRGDIDYLLLNVRGETPSRTSLIVGLVLLAYGAAFLMMQYLRGGLFGRTEAVETDSLPASVATVAVSALRNKVSSLADEVASLKVAQLDALAGNRQQLVEALKPTIHEGVADELEERFRNRLSQSARDQEVRETFAAAEHRLKAELDALGRRSNLNLVIGVLTTTIAVGLLTYMVLGAVAEFGTLTSLLSHYIPRLGLVLFIEVFSFFFLRLYKTTLSEMRMYQTDLTALTIQRVAVLAGLSAGDSAGAAALSKELLTCTSVKQETTTEQKSDVDPKALAELVQALAKILPAKGKDA